MADGARRATMTTVARALGVSPSTVSNAYNRPDQLSADLRARVLATAARLGYAGPDPVARTLRHGRTGAIGLVYDEPLSFSFTDPAAVLCLRGVAAACERHAVGLTLVPRLPAGAPDLVGTALVDGLVLYCLPADDDRLRVARERGLPVVAVDSPRPPLAPAVTVDDRGGARAAARHLLDLGHRRVAVVAERLAADGWEGTAPRARQDANPYDGTRERLAGYRDAWEAAGLDWDAVRVEERAPYGRDAGRRAARDLLADRPTAVLAMSDELALGVLDAAAARGLRVPGDLSVVGFDDTPSAAAAGLTTVAQPHLEKGAAAARLLLDLPGGAAAPPPLPTRLVVRTSTAAS